MKFINAQLETLQSKEKIQGFYDDIEYIESFLEKEKINIPDEIKLTFSNHVFVLLNRIKNNDCTTYSEIPTEEISKISLEQSKNLLNPLFSKYGIEENKMEEILLAIYLEMGGNHE